MEQHYKVNSRFNEYTKYGSFFRFLIALRNVLCYS